MNGAILKEIIFQKNEGSLYLNGTFSSVKTKLNSNLIIRQRINTRNIFIPIDFEVETKWENECFFVELDINRYQNILSEGEIWDIFFLIDNKKYFLNTTEKKEFDFFDLNETLFKMKPFITKNNNIALFVNPQKIEWEIISLKVLNDEISLNVKINLKIKVNARIIFFNESVGELNILDNQFYIEGIKGNENIFIFNISKNDLKNADFSKGKQSWTTELQIYQGNRSIGIPLIISSNQLREDSSIQFMLNFFYMAKIIIQKEKTLALEVNRIYSGVFLDYISLNKNSEIYLRFIVPENQDKIKVNSIKLVPRNKFASTYYPPFEISIPAKKDNHIYNSEFNLSSIFDKQQKYDNSSWDIFVEVSDNATNQKVRLPIDVTRVSKSNLDYSDIGDGFEIKPYKTSNGKLSFWMRKNDSLIKYSKQDVIKIAVLGSCYSRAAFNSSVYFNPGYKEKYKVVYSQFHSSIVSTMSNYIKYEEKYFSHYNDSEKMFIRDDLEKLFFEKIKNSKPDFLILDFYSDVFLDLIVIDEEHIFTGNYFIRGSEFLLNLPKGTKVISRDNLEKYLNYWNKSIFEFTKKIKEYIGEDKIILQKARSIDKYYDKDHQIKKFKDQDDVIMFNNFLYEYMERTFLNLLPHSQVIDLNQCGYIGQYNYPDGNSFNHYEPNYYKRFMSKIDEIVTKSFLKKYKTL